MAVYTKKLIIVDTPEEAEAINADVDRSEMFYDHYAIHYGCHATGFRYEELESRYTGDRHSAEWERYITSCKRNDLTRGFTN